MRRVLQFMLLGIFLGSAVTGVLVAFLWTDAVTEEAIARDVDATHAAIVDKFRTFDFLLAREEDLMERRMAAALPVVAAELLGPPPSFAGRTPQDLAALARRTGVDNVYVIDRDTVVVATDFAPDLGFELGTISPDIRRFLTGLLGTGRFTADRINLSSKTGILRKYAYFSPPGSDHIAEVSIDVREFLAREQSPAFADFLFGGFFRELVTRDPDLTGIDIHMVNPVGIFSLFDRNSDLPPAAAHGLRTADRIVEKDGARVTVYSRISPVASRLETADFLAVTATYDFSTLAAQLRTMVLALLAAMLAVSALSYLVVERVAARRIVGRIERIRRGLAAIAGGAYDSDLDVGGRDEIGAIAADINAMRRRIAEDIRRRERDAADLARATAEAEAAREAAEAANRAKSRFLSSVSHELRTPLHAIGGFARLLRQRQPEATPATDAAPGGAPARNDLLDRLIRATGRLTRIVDNLLDLAQAERGVLSVTPERVAPGPLIADALDLVAESARERDIVLADRTSGVSLPDIVADPQRLSQVLLNLLANALKYSGTGGSVAVEAAPLPDGRLRISVTDSGPGIPAGRAEEVFGWFERLGREAGDVDGVGIGLALCQDLVTRMDGTIGFDNHAAGGCTFRVDLPLAGPVAEPVDEPGAGAGTALLTSPVAGTVVAPAAAAPERRRRILYIEDSEDLLALMETAFAALLPDCDLRVARDAESGLATVAAWRPDVVLMDVNLPGMDGIAATRRLKDDPATAGIPVIAATGAVTDHDRTRTRDAGFFAVLSKPFQIEELFVVIEQALGAAVPRGNEDPNATGGGG